MRRAKLHVLVRLALLGLLTCAAAGVRACDAVPVECVDTCPAEGERTCSAGAVVECQQAADTCREWVVLGSCGDWAECHDGACKTFTVLPGPCGRSQDGGDVQNVDFGPPDGSPDDVWTYAYDDTGRLVRKENDKPYLDVPRPDGVADYVAEYHFDGDLLIRLDEWAPVDVLWMQSTWEYDELGRMIAETRDYHADFVPDQLFSYAYSEDGRFVEEFIDWDADGRCGPSDFGPPDSLRTYEYGERGELLRETSDGHCDGSIEWLVSYAYDARGLLIWRGYDGHMADDVFDDVVWYTYDADGRLIRTDGDVGDDGDIDGWTQWRYAGSSDFAVLEWTESPDLGCLWVRMRQEDGAGNVVREVLDKDCDGGPDREMRYSYECWVPHL